MGIFKRFSQSHSEAGLLNKCAGGTLFEIKCDTNFNFNTFKIVTGAGLLGDVLQYLTKTIYEISLSSTTCSNNCSLEDDDDFLGNNEQCLAQTLLEFLDFL